MRDIYEFNRITGLDFLVLEVIGLSQGKNIQVVAFTENE